MEILGGVASTLVEIMVGAFVSFCRAQGRREALTQKRREIMDFIRTRLYPGKNTSTGGSS